METSRLTPATLVILGLSLFLIRNLVRSLRPDRFPPGPPRLPIIGNLHQIPKVSAHLVFTQWNKEYGEIVGLRVFGQPAIVLGSHRVVRELLEKRASNSSTRPRLVMIEDICQISKFASLNSDMDLHKHYRRMFAQALGSRAVPNYYPVQIREMRRAVFEMLQTNNDEAWLVSIRRAVSSLTSQIVYAREAKTADDPFIAKVNRILRSVEKAGRPGEYIVEGLTFLKYLPAWFPGGGFIRAGLKIRQDCQELVDEPFEAVKRDLVAGNASSCFVANLLLQDDGTVIDDPEEEERIKWAAGVLFGGGVDTTVAALQMFLVALLLFPEAQKKAQEEVDRVIGKARMPTVGDCERLPYCSAMVQEILRWEAVVPLCIPHVLTEEEEYEGYILPKGSILLPNSWALARDAEVYAHPEVFKPERFLAPDGTPSVGGSDGREVFGYGRRLCPGNYLAEASIFAFICTFIWASDLAGKEGWDGTVPEYEGGIVNRPLTIPAEIRSRSGAKMEMLRSVIVD